MNKDLKNRISRFGRWVTEDLLTAPVVVIGTGSVGRPATLLLASTGFTNLVLFDDDVVDESNLGTQGWNASDLGTHKVEALNEQIARVNPDCKVKANPTKFTENATFHDLGVPVGAFAILVVVAVDSIEARRTIHQWFENNYSGDIILVDARTLTRECRILTWSPTNTSVDADLYHESLHEEGEILTGLCNDRSCFWGATNAACWLVNNLIAAATGCQYSPDFTVSMSTGTIHQRHKMVWNEDASFLLPEFLTDEDDDDDEFFDDDDEDDEELEDDDELDDTDDTDLGELASQLDDEEK